jgi:CO/xanthine dehydrogenase Mo-binding subunit
MGQAHSRRDFLKAGALVISFGAPVSQALIAGLADAAETGAKPPLLPSELDSFIAVNADGTVGAFFGKIDAGHGLGAGIAQIVAEELDVPFGAVTVLMGDTDTSVNQGGASGSTGISLGGKQMRAAAAEARRVLVGLAAAKLSMAPEQIAVTDGVCAAGGKQVSYGDLLGGRYFNTQLTWNKAEGNALYAPGLATPKDPKDYKLVGKPMPRGDIAWKVYGTGDYASDIRVPGMLHGRVLRPPVAGAGVVAIDANSVAAIPGARLLRQGDFVGVVAPKEWDAIRALRAAKVQWSDAKPSFVDNKDIYDHIRAAPARHTQDDAKGAKGDVDAAMKTAAKIVEAEYEWPFQSHASMGPACAVAQFTPDGHLNCWMGGQKPHYSRTGIAAAFKLPPDKVHVKWVQGPGSYGRNEADDCLAEAVQLAQLAGAPVRLQYMRGEGTGWDPKAPASVHHARAGLDADGNVIAFEFNTKGFSRIDVDTNAASPNMTLLGQTLGLPLHSQDAFDFPVNSYEFANKRQTWTTIAPQLDRASPLRTSHLRDPAGPQLHFASESFIDEIATAIGADPVAFRLKYAKDPRDIGVIRKAAELYGWDARPSPRAARGDVVTGRGIAATQRDGTHVAIVAEVAVDRKSGQVRVNRIVVAQDCGLVVNPRSMKTTIEGNVMQGISRAFKEEVRFTPANVTSVDWLTYPVAEIDDRPAKIDIALVQRPGDPPNGAGEPSIRPMAAALANAVFDATGVRLRRAPLSPDRLKSALST